MRNTENRTGRNLLIGLLAGVAAGAAAGWFLNTDRGRELRRNTTRDMNRWARKTELNLRNELEDLTEKANEFVDRTKAIAEKAKITLREKIENYTHV